MTDPANAIGAAAARPGGRAFQDGTSWKGGKLYAFSRSSVTVVRPWPQPMAWTRSLAEPAWKHVRPHVPALPPQSWQRPDDPALGIQLQLPLRWQSGACREREAWRSFWELAPPRVCRVVGRLKERRWHALQLCARVPGGTELFEANPFLAFCLASSWVFRQGKVARPLRSARALAGKPHRAILGWLGMPDGEGAAKVTRRVLAEALDVGLCLGLAAALRDAPTAKLLSHMPVLDQEILALASCAACRPLLHGKLLQQLADNATRAERGRRTTLAWLMRDCVGMWTQLGRPAARLPPMDSVERVRSFHDELAAQHRRRAAAELEAAVFPEPPIAAATRNGVVITPVTCRVELLQHAAAQRNCVASYAARVNGGGWYIYAAARDGETCTVALHRDARRWSVGEIAASCNRPASDEVRRAVAAWLADAA